MPDFTHLLQQFEQMEEPEAQQPLAPSAIERAPKGPSVAPAYTRSVAEDIQGGTEGQPEPENDDLSTGDVLEDLETIIAKPDIPEADKKRLREILNYGRQTGASRFDIVERVIAAHDERLNPLQRAAEKTIVGRALGRAGVKVGDALQNAPLRVAGMFGNEEADAIADARNEAYARMAAFDKVRNDHSATAAVFGTGIANGLDVVTESVGQAVIGGGVGRFVAGAAGKATTGLASTVGNAALFGLSASDHAYTEGGRAGLKGWKRYAYGAGIGGLEAGIMMAFGAYGARHGIRSLEDAPLREVGKLVRSTAVRSGLDKALKSGMAVGKGMTSEGLEEGLTQFTQNIWGKVFGFEKGALDGVGHAAVLGAFSAGAMNAPSHIADNLNRSLTKAQVIVQSQADALHFRKDNPRVDPEEVINARNKKEFEALTGMKRTSQQYRKEFQQSLKEQITEDTVAEDAIGSSVEAQQQQQQAQGRDARLREAQGDPLPQVDPRNATEAVEKAAQTEQVEGFPQYQPPPQGEARWEFGQESDNQFEVTLRGPEGDGLTTVRGTVTDGALRLDQGDIPAGKEGSELITGLMSEAASRGVDIQTPGEITTASAKQFSDLMAQGYDVEVNPAAQLTEKNGQMVYATPDGSPVVSVKPRDGDIQKAKVQAEGAAIRKAMEENPEDYEGGVGTLHASLNEIRASLDLGTLTSAESITWETTKQEAMAGMQSGKLNARDLADAVMMGRRRASGLDRVEKAVIAIRLAQLKNEFQKMTAEVGRLKETGDLHAIDKANTRIDRIISESDVLTDVGFRAGSEVGALLNQQKLLLDDDLNLIAYRGRMRAAKKGKLSEADDDFALQISTDWTRVNNDLTEAYNSLSKEVGDRFVQHAKTSEPLTDTQTLMTKIRTLLQKGCDLL